MESHLSTATANVTVTNAGETAATVTPIAPSAAIRLPSIKIEPFFGDTETWARFLRAVQAVDRRRSVTNNHQ